MTRKPSSPKRDFDPTSTVYHQAQFLLGAAALRQLPADDGLEVAFAGRSNAGKSSAINTITGRNGLARTSKTPGRTQQINLFALDDQRRLVDLPGYGYAQVSLEVKRHWQQVMQQYLSERQSLRGVILLMDVRHPLKDFDVQMLEWCRLSEMPVHILLTKSDKLSRGPASKALLEVRAQLTDLCPGATVQLFSSLKRDGVAEAVAVLDVWLEIAAPAE